MAPQSVHPVIQNEAPLVLVCLAAYNGMQYLPEQVDTILGQERVRVALLRCGDTRIELLEPTAPDSPIAKAIEKRGEGLHHVGYRVDDCQAALDAMVAAGATPIDQAPRPGSRGTTVAFVHPKGAFGTLIELVQE